MHPPSHTTLFSHEPYPSESFFLTLPQPTIQSLQSDFPLHTHGSEPPESSALCALLPSAYGHQSINSLDTNADSQNWIVEQVRSIRYEAAAKTFLGTSGVSADFPSVSNELESKKQKLVKGGAAVDSVRVCTICNVACNSQDVYSKHLSGKKHAAQISLISDNGIGPYIAALKSHGIGPWKKGPKKTKFTQPAWCELCKISCTSRDAYSTHLAGKKHLRNLELLSKSNNDLQLKINPVIGPHEKPNSCKDEGIVSHMPNKAAMVEDIEAKKRKLVEGGVAETDIRICTLCNVVCNSHTVFYFHLGGQKHADMVKLKQEQAGSN